MKLLLSCLLTVAIALAAIVLLAFAVDAACGRHPQQAGRQLTFGNGVP